MLTTRLPATDAQWVRALEQDRGLRSRVPQLRQPLLADWQDNHRLVVDKGVPWIFGPVEIDPLLDRQGRMPLPDDIAAELRALAAAGAEFDRIVIAHELDAEGPVASLCDDVPAWGRPISGADARRCVVPPTASEATRSGASQLDDRVRRAAEIGRGIARTAAVVAAAPLALPLAVMDPIIFGVNGIGAPPRHDEPAVFYPLAAWVW